MKIAILNLRSVLQFYLDQPSNIIYLIMNYKKHLQINAKGFPVARRTGFDINNNKQQNNYKHIYC